MKSKMNKDARITLWIEKPLHDWFSDFCRANNSTMSEVVRDYIQLLSRIPKPPRASSPSETGEMKQINELI